MVLLRSGSLEDKKLGQWDDFWKKKGRLYAYSWAKERIRRILSDYVRPGISVLDAGCGTGFFSSYFISNGCQTYSLDYSKIALSITKEATGHKSKMYIEGDILDETVLAKIGTKFDLIFTDGLLEHYSKMEQDKIVMNMKALKKGRGYIINFVPNAFSLWSAVRPFCIDIEEHPFMVNELLNLHKKNSLNVIASGGINVVPFRFSPERIFGRYFGMLLYCVCY